MLFVVGGVLVAFALGVVFFGEDETAEVAPQTQSIDLSKEPVVEPATTSGNNTPARQVEMAKPDSPVLDTQSTTKPLLSLEIARVKPDGASVLAGSAPPGAVISVFEDKIMLGKTTADANGEWIVVLEKRLGVGQHLISVAAELDGGSSIMAETSIAIEIYADQSTKPLVALLPENKTKMPMFHQLDSFALTMVLSKWSKRLLMYYLVPLLLLRKLLLVWSQITSRELSTMDGLVPPD